MVIVKSHSEAVLEVLCDVMPKTLVWVSGKTPIPLTPQQGATHLLHARWEAGGCHGAADIQLEQVIYILVSACREPDVCMLSLEESSPITSMHLQSTD